MKLTSAQEKAVRTESRNLQLIACAGNELNSDGDRVYRFTWEDGGGTNGIPADATTDSIRTYRTTSTNTRIARTGITWYTTSSSSFTASPDRTIALKLHHSWSLPQKPLLGLRAMKRGES